MLAQPRDRPVCTAVTLAFKVLEDRSQCLASATACVTRSAIVHCETVLTVSCSGLRCVYCEELRQVPERLRVSGFQNFARNPFHTLSYSVTGVAPRDRVYRVVNRVFQPREPCAPWVFVSASPLSPTEGQRLLAFLDFCQGKPFDSWQFYLNPLRCLVPETCVLRGPSLQPFPFDYSGYTGGWTCSSLALAAIQFLGVCPNLAPAHANPTRLLCEVEQLEGWQTSTQPMPPGLRYTGAKAVPRRV